MSKTTDAAAAAEAEHEAALEELRAAQERAAESGQTLAATKFETNVPEMEVVVNDNAHVSHNGKAYYGKGYPLAPEDLKVNDTVKLDGPTALALFQQGLVTIKGAA